MECAPPPHTHISVPETVWEAFPVDCTPQKAQAAVCKHGTWQAAKLKGEGKDRSLPQGLTVQKQHSGGEQRKGWEAGRQKQGKSLHLLLLLIVRRLGWRRLWEQAACGEASRRGRRLGLEGGNRSMWAGGVLGGQLQAEEGGGFWAAQSDEASRERLCFLHPRPTWGESGLSLGASPGRSWHVCSHGSDALSA